MKKPKTWDKAKASKLAAKLRVERLLERRRRARLRGAKAAEEDE